jgi:hypothetical protein
LPESVGAMKLGTLLRIAAIYMGVVGVGLILAPRAFGVGAVPENASAELIAFLRLWGSPLLGIAALNWITRNEGPSVARDGIIVGNIVGFSVIAAVDVWGTFVGGARPVTKVFAVIHLLFAAAFIWIGRKSMSARAR